LRGRVSKDGHTVKHHRIAPQRRLTKTEMAKLMATSRAQLDRVLNPDDGNVTLDSLQRAAKVLGRDLKLELV